MISFSKGLLIALRVALGWLFLYAGVTKVFAQQWFGAENVWTAAGYLNSAKTFPAFYQWLAGDSMIGLVDFANQWGLTLIGIALIAGVFVRLSAVAGAAIMLLYYFPVLDFPQVGAHSYIVDDHIIYALALLFLAAMRAGRAWGVDAILKKRSGLLARFT